MVASQVASEPVAKLDQSRSSGEAGCKGIVTRRQCCLVSVSVSRLGAVAHACMWKAHRSAAVLDSLSRAFLGGDSNVQTRLSGLVFGQDDLAPSCESRRPVFRTGSPL